MRHSAVAITIAAVITLVLGACDNAPVPTEPVSFQATTAHSASASADQALICHTPPGNSENQQTIEVSPSAVDAHLAHGDRRGECGDPCAEVVIEDPNLEAIVRSRLGLGPDEAITTELAAAFNGSVYLWHSEVVSLQGLECFTAVVSIDISHTRITDLSPIAGLEELSVFTAVGTAIDDFSALAGMNKLQVVDLSEGAVSSLEFAKLPNLHVLDLSETPLTSLDGLEAPLLMALDVGDSEITSLRGLSTAAPALRVLTAHGAELTDLQGIAGLTQLETLNVPGNRITDVSGLRDNPSLQLLRAGGNQISDLSGLAAFVPSLAWVYLEDNALTSLRGLEGAPELRDLIVTDNDLTDISAVATLPELVWFHASGNRVSDVSGFANHSSVTDVRLDDNLVSDPAPFTTIPTLRRLSLLDNPVDCANADRLALISNGSVLYLDSCA